MFYAQSKDRKHLYKICSLQVAIAQIALGVLIDSQIHDKLAILLDKPFEYADFSQLAAR